MIRPAIPGDAAALGALAEAADLFPAEMIHDMMAPFFTQSRGAWLVAVGADEPLGFCYLEPEKLTENTWNMLALAVAPARQGAGHGTALVAEAESQLRDWGGRLLIVETAGTADYAATRDFYARRGFTREAVLRDFYADGIDKVVFRKRL